jgi:DNA-binding transcriptional LysR family regulator
MAESYVSTALSCVVDEHSQVKISVRVDHWQQLTEWLLSGELDFFVADMANAVGDDRLECISLPDEEFVWFCRAGHPLAEAKNLSRDELFRFPVVTPRLPPWAAEWFAAAEAAGDKGHVRSLPTLQCENYSLLKRIVLSSDSVCTALEATIRQELKQQELVSLPVIAPKLKTHAGIVRLHHRSDSPLAAAAIETILSLAAEVHGTSG